MIRAPMPLFAARPPASRRSSQASTSSAGPSVISRYCSDGGYLVRFSQPSVCVQRAARVLDPGLRLAVEVAEAQQQKARDQRQSDPVQRAAAGIGRRLEQRAEPVAERHHADPRHQRIEDADLEAAGQPAEMQLVQQVPGDRRRRPFAAEVLGADAVEAVVAEHDHRADGDDRRAWQPQQCRQKHHRPAERPQHLQLQAVEIEAPDQVVPGDFQQHDPQAAADQEALQRRAIECRAALVQPGAGAGQQHEHRRAEVGDPASQEQQPGRLRQVGGVVAVVDEVIAAVVECHDHDHQPAQAVDRAQAGSARLTRRRAHAGTAFRTTASSSSSASPV
jgi:hypothetical protein